MRLPNTEHTSRAWRIHELTRDFRLEDVWGVGELLGWDDPEAGHGSQRPTLRDRLPRICATPHPARKWTGASPRYQLDDKWAAEIVNRTVHEVFHIGWVPEGTGGYGGDQAATCSSTRQRCVRSSANGKRTRDRARPLARLDLYPHRWRT